MPIGFPSSPVDGQEWPVVDPVWAYSAARTRWEALPVSGGAVVPVDGADWTLTAGIGSASLNVLTPPIDGGVEYRVGAGSPVALPGDGSGAHTIPGLSSGVPVDVQVRAVYLSAWGDAKSVTPTAPSVAIVQETNPVYWQDPGTNTINYSFPQATAAGNTLVVHCTHGYWNTLTLTDSAGGTVAGGQWTKEIDDGAFSTAGDGDPLANTADRQHVWVRRNCPAGITGVTMVTSAGAILGRTCMREVSGLSNVAGITRLSARNVASQTAVAISVAGAGFMSAMVRTSPSATPVSASTGSVVRRANFLTDNTTAYTGAVSEHTVHGISTGARDFNSSWPDGASSIGYHGIFIPAA